MQFSNLVILLGAIVGAVSADRADTIKAGLRIVGNHQADSYHANSRASQANLGSGNVVQGYMQANEAGRNRQNAHAIGGAVGGVKRPRSLEYLGSDDTHEYFARSIEDDYLQARDFDEYDLYAY